MREKRPSGGVSSIATTTTTPLDDTIRLSTTSTQRGNDFLCWALYTMASDIQNSALPMQSTWTILSTYSKRRRHSSNCCCRRDTRVLHSLNFLSTAASSSLCFYQWLEDGAILSWFLRGNDWNDGTSPLAQKMMDSVCSTRKESLFGLW